MPQTRESNGKPSPPPRSPGALRPSFPLIAKRLIRAFTLLCLLTLTRPALAGLPLLAPDERVAKAVAGLAAKRTARSAEMTLQRLARDRDEDTRAAASAALAAHLRRSDRHDRASALVAPWSDLVSENNVQQPTRNIQYPRQIHKNLVGWKFLVGYWIFSPSKNLMSLRNHEAPLKPENMVLNRIEALFEHALCEAEGGHPLTAFRILDYAREHAKGLEAAGLYRTVSLVHLGRAPEAERALKTFVSAAPLGLYRGEAMMVLGDIALQARWSPTTARRHYQDALDWCERAKAIREGARLYAVPNKARAPSRAPQKW
jgi:hypothetical protein